MLIPQKVEREMMPFLITFLMNGMLHKLKENPKLLMK